MARNLMNVGRAEIVHLQGVVPQSAAHDLRFQMGGSVESPEIFAVQEESGGKTVRKVDGAGKSRGS
jgi:hypothetical protein